MDRVLVDVDVNAGIADVRLNWSDKLNACDFEMLDALGQAGRAGRGTLPARRRALG